MKRLIYFIVALSFGLGTVGCTLESGHTKQPASVGTWIWDSVAGDIKLMQEMMETSYYLNTYLGLDEADKENYFNSYLYGYKLSQKGDAYVLSKTTSINTNIEMSYTYTGEALKVVRTGGNHSELVITPLGDTTFDAHFTKLHNKASVGSARFSVEVISNRAVEDDDSQRVKEVVFSYSGNFSMVDTEESVKKPLTYEVVIDEALQYSLTKGYITAGRLHIDCWDAVYNSHDYVGVVFDDNPRQIYVSSYGETETVYYY